MSEKEISDRELIRQIQEGSETAFVKLYHRYVKLAYYIAYKLCKNRADCDDIVQETFVQVKDKIQDLKNPDLFRYWLNRIVLSKCKNLFRRNKYLTYEAEHYEAQHNLLETRRDRLPQEAMKHLCDYEIIDALVDELPLGQKEVVLLHYLQQFSVEETADLLHLPIGTVKSRLSYARTTLKEKIIQYEEQMGVKLNFHSFDAFLTACMSASFAKVILPKKFAIPSIEVKWVEPSVVSGVLSKVLISTVVGATALGTGAIVKQYFDNKKQPTLVSDLARTNEETEVSTFPAITLKNKEIKTARIAFYTIKTWGHCEDELMHMDTEDLSDVYALYEHMKADNSVYYHQLEEEGWSDALHRAMEKNQ